MGSAHNLAPAWVKGQSGNPKGRPKELPALRKILTELLTEEHQGEQAAKLILRALIEKAMEGDLRAAEFVINKAYGREPIPLDVGSRPPLSWLNEETPSWFPEAEQEN